MRLSRRTWIISGLAAAAVLAAGAITLSLLPGAAGRPAAVQPAADSASSPSSSPSSATPSGGATARPAPSAKNTPPAAGKRFTTEVIPADPAASPALPPSTPIPYPVSAPLPKSASATGGIVEGFPDILVPQLQGSKVSTSSVASDSPNLQVSLTGTTSGSVTDVVEFYRQALAKVGMYDTAAPALGGATAVTYSRDGNAVTLTATPGDSGTSYALYGTFTAKG
ncbi:hypothetical protein LLS1_13300 [Leifsonia sp. LS1]|uniref:hypothetical protein n=1 Tax=Leifsonia sp. LS1 TaxID=2828483 RepID=UPI001CFD23EC|nr:hypothetical protein [Leifsonia sp. LS1]GIT79661.1 hypothetical protein LLS1_13300 [Leifsonia sp. LS1]